MAKVRFSYFGLEMEAMGPEKFIEEQVEAFLAHVERDSIRSTVELEKPAESAELPLTAAEKMPGGMEHDVVAIYDNAGIPSIMHRFRRTTNKELFGGSDKVHPAFIIGDEVYDEVFISVYKNTMINGKPYSLPKAEPACGISMEDFAEACFSKGEGWHCMTAVEWGLLANISLKLGTARQRNKDFGTWTHDKTITGVQDLSGCLWEHCRGVRIKDGELQAAKNNNAALRETDLTKNGDGWKPILDNAGRPLRVSVSADGDVSITPKRKIEHGCAGCRWEDVNVECESEQLKELALGAEEPNAYFWIDSNAGEHVLCRGGSWFGGIACGVLNTYLDLGRSYAYTGIGGRSAYFKKHKMPDVKGERQHETI